MHQTSRWQYFYHPADQLSIGFIFIGFIFKSGYRIKKGISFFIEAKNLTNKIYAATTGILSNAGGADSAQFLPGEGRSLVSGVEFKR